VKLPAPAYRQAGTGRGFTDSRDFPVSAKMELPDKNVRPIGFLESLHLPQDPRPQGRGILQHFRKIFTDRQGFLTLPKKYIICQN